MIHVLNTIIPVFAIIILGNLLCLKQILPSHILAPLNRLVYYIAIPAMIFQAVGEADFDLHYNAIVLVGTLSPVIVVFGIALSIGRLASLHGPRKGTFMQISFHGNLGYIGFAVCFYLLGKEAFTQASILAAFLILLQNVLAVLSLQVLSREKDLKNRPLPLMRRVFLNPVILSALAGILFSHSGLSMPEILGRTLNIISGMALPLALLVIGASLSFRLIESNLGLTLTSGALKLIVLPGLGLAVFGWLGISSEKFLPALVLLASPPATVSYVMAGEMDGSVDLASAAISANTLISAGTFALWLSPFV